MVSWFEWIRYRIARILPSTGETKVQQCAGRAECTESVNSVMVVEYDYMKDTVISNLGTLSMVTLYSVGGRWMNEYGAMVE
jgi:hypothetical protein